MREREIIAKKNFEFVLSIRCTIKGFEFEFESQKESFEVEGESLLGGPSRALRGVKGPQHPSADLDDADRNGQLGGHLTRKVIVASERESRTGRSGGRLRSLARHVVGRRRPRRLLTDLGHVAQQSFSRDRMSNALTDSLKHVTKYEN